jgi:Protein of unknown function (DUF4079)
MLRMQWFLLRSFLHRPHQHYVRQTVSLKIPHTKQQPYQLSIPFKAHNVEHHPVSFISSMYGIGLSLFDSVAEPIQSYVNIWTPLFVQAQEAGLVPDFLLRWGHGAAMASVLLSMGLIGSWMGWQIRLGNGNVVNALSLGETMRVAHPKIMGGAFFFFLLGGQGGLVLLDTQGGTILQSSHAVTAVIGMSLLGVQALLPVFFDKSPAVLRSVHAYLGSAILMLLFAHLVSGVQLGLSL